MTNTTREPVPAGGNLIEAPISNANLAVVHEWLTDWGGSEAVTAALLGLQANSKLYALFDFLSPADRAKLDIEALDTTFLQKLPGMHRRFWYWLWLMPAAIESLDLREHELILSSSHAFAKGVLTGSDQLHISYVHSPMRYAWDMHHEYMADYALNRGLKSLLARLMFSKLRQWDRHTAHNVDLFIANSNYVARRIWRAYRRPALVIPPPVAINKIPYQEAKEDFYLTVSRLVSYKRIDLIVDAFSRMPQRKLVIVGDGPEIDSLKRKARPNIEFLGYQSDEEVHSLLGRARAFVFAAREDFGITPVEAQAAGTPVIAFGAGGALETICGPSPERDPELTSGRFFTQQSAESLQTAIECFEQGPHINPAACRKSAERFSQIRFHERMQHTINQSLSCWRNGDNPETLIGQC